MKTSHAAEEGGPAITYTVFPELWPKARTEYADVPWHDLCARVHDAPIYVSKRHCPLLSLSEYGEKLSDKGCIRHAENVKRVFGVEVDYDGEEISPEEGAKRLQAAGLTAIIYTSPSHTDGAPRWRALLPLADPAIPPLRQLYVARANRALGGIASSESFTLSQSFYFGRIRGAAYRVIESHGRTIDQAADLEPQYYVGHTDGKSTVDRRTDQELREAFKRGEDRYTAMLKLSSRWAARGMELDDIEATLHALLDDSSSSRNADGIDLRTRCRPLAESATRKFNRGPWQNEPPGKPTPDDYMPPVAELPPDIELPPPLVEAGAIPAQDAPQPFDLWSQLPPVAGLPRGILPPTIEELAFCKPDTFPPAALAAAALATCSMAASDLLRVEINANWRERFSFWVGLVGSSASGKSPTIGTALRPLLSVQADAFEAHEQAKAEYQERNRRRKKNGEDEPEAEPICPRYVTHNATIEALTELERHTEHGLGLIHDELSALIAAMDGQYKERTGSERGHWLALYDGGPHTTDRIQRGSVYVRNHSAAILGGITLDKLRGLVANMAADGLMSRISLITMPISSPSDDLDPIPYEAWQAYEGLVRRIALNRPHKPKSIPLDPDARALLGQAKKRWQAESIRQSEYLPRYAERLGKLPGLAARLALGFAIIEQAEFPGHGPTEIDPPRSVRADQMQRAIAWVDYQSSHDLAFYASAGDREVIAGMTGARKVGAWILRHGRTEFRMGDLARGILEWRSLKNSEHAAILELLENLGWVTPITPDDGPPFRGMTFVRGTLWRVEPAVHALFSERAEHEARVAQEARQKLQEATKGTESC